MNQIELVYLILETFSHPSVLQFALMIFFIALGQIRHSDARILVLFLKYSENEFWRKIN